MSPMASENHPLHFVMLPLMSPGHFIPMLDMAKLLAKRQEISSITVITTPIVASKYEPVVDRARQTSGSLSLRLVPLRFPVSEFGLQEGCESLDLVPSKDLLMNFFHAIYKLQEPFEQLLQGMEPRPSCIISDKYIAWVAESARKLGVPRIIFDGMSCFTTLTQHNLYATKAHESVDDQDTLVLPGLPDKVETVRAHLPMEFTKAITYEAKMFCEAVKAATDEAYGIVINSFDALESGYMEELKKAKKGKIWCVGPLSLCNEEESDKAERGHKDAAIEERECVKWLDEKEPGSVVYACHGSLSRLTATQLKELGLGLEATKRPFVWVMRGGDTAKEIDKWIQEEGFEQRIRGRGLLIRGWAPQVLILSHPAVGAFVTHCGWNSTLEGICAGVPLITWPMFAEQFFNEKLVVEVLKTGVSLGNQQVVNMCEEDQFGVLVKREKVVEGVERVMDIEGTEEGKERKERARLVGEKAKMALMEEGGSSYLNMTLLIQDILSLQNYT